MKYLKLLQYHFLFLILISWVVNQTILTNALSMFFIKIKPVFSKDPKSLPKNPPDCPILCNWAFDNFILAEEPLQKLYEASELLY